MDNEIKSGLKKFGRNDLEEVKADAKVNYLKRLREQREAKKYEEAREKGAEAAREFVDKELDSFRPPREAKESKSTTKGK